MSDQEPAATPAPTTPAAAPATAPAAPTATTTTLATAPEPATAPAATTTPLTPPSTTPAAQAAGTTDEDEEKKSWAKENLMGIATFVAILVLGLLVLLKPASSSSGPSVGDMASAMESALKADREANPPADTPEPFKLEDLTSAVKAGVAEIPKPATAREIAEVVQKAVKPLEDREEELRKVLALKILSDQESAAPERAVVVGGNAPAPSSWNEEVLSKDELDPKTVIWVTQRPYNIPTRLHNGSKKGITGQTAPPLQKPSGWENAIWQKINQIDWALYMQ